MVKKCKNGRTSIESQPIQYLRQILQTYVKQVTELSNWRKWEQKLKHLAPILRGPFKAIRNQYKSNKRK